MKKTVFFDYAGARSFFEQSDWDFYSAKISLAHAELTEKTGAGNEALGWLNLPNDYDQEEFDEIKSTAAKIIENSEVLLVIGIGGSYLGAKSVIDCLTDSFYNYSANTKIFFAGNNLSSNYLQALLREIEGKDVSVNVISKSGTTTEPAIAFKVIKNWMEKKYGKDRARERIFVTTSKGRGSLNDLALSEGYKTFVIPDNIGGRFSVLTAVGLLPIAVCGADIDELMSGAAAACRHFKDCNLADNDCYQYAAVRNILYSKGKNVEILVNYEPEFEYFTKWWQQLYGESEGKDGKGIFPTGVNFSADLHSMGQYIQQGARNIFETVLCVQNSKVDLALNQPNDVNDGLEFLAGKTMDFVNKKAFWGTYVAHIDGGVANLVINLEQADEYNLGQLIYFFEKSCAMSGYVLGINPFNQPGVEAYKKNMFALLGKPGYEMGKLKLEDRIKNMKDS